MVALSDSLAMVTLGSLLRRVGEDPSLAEAIGAGTGTLAVVDAARAVAVAALAASRPGAVTLVCVAMTRDVEDLVNDLGIFLGPENVLNFPAWETLPFERVSPSPQTAGRRAEVLWRLTGRQEMPGGPLVIVGAVRSLVQRLGPLEAASIEPVILRQGEMVDMDRLLERVVAMGYRREYQVEHPGEVAVRGGIVDIYPSTARSPIRMELFGDELERLREIDPGDQRSTGDLAEVYIFPSRELPTTKHTMERGRQLIETEPWGREHWQKFADGQLFDGMESWMPWFVDDELLLCDLLDDESQVLVLEPGRARERVNSLVEEERDLAAVLARTWGVLDVVPEGSRLGAGTDGLAGAGGAVGGAGSGGGGGVGGLRQLHLGYERMLERCKSSVLSISSLAEDAGTALVRATGWDAGFGAMKGVLDRLVGLLADDYSVTICASQRSSADRIWASLRSEGLDVPFSDQAAAGSGHGGGLDGDGLDLSRPGARLVIEPLDRGFVLLDAKIAVLSEADLSAGRRRPHRAPKIQRPSVEGFFDSLRTGDLVVHAHHGIARYGGMVTRALGGSNRDYLLLEYRGGDKLYVPTDQIGVVTPYTGGEAPALSRMGGSDWARTKSKVRSSVQEIAEELVELYRKRLVTEGHSFRGDPAGEAQVDADFPYALTRDQARAIDEVKADMELPVPMDRLVCGDVGFGKTEVAIRAAARAVLDGKQVAVLVPTTLLASQHYQTFSDRFSGLAVQVAMLSRFLTDAQAREVETQIAQGAADIVVGTHRLLSGGVRFRDLGLLIVDEEQRFGVEHKEAVKKLAAGVDVLTLTANPIPRTLEMSLVGIRELTLIRTPPVERRPILTYVGEHDERAVCEAVRRELLREGQVFYVHNRVRDIHLVAERLRQLVPEARVSVAHGQMDEGALESVALDFWEQRSDVLVCTTIIESGIDIPNVNTLVVDTAHTLGLGQLHQLRGRVGRSGQRAYAYLFYPPGRQLSDGSYERLKAIGQNTELGSGFKLAMRDLEMRGAGNILGKSQSGHIAAVGYDLYVQMVSEAVSELKGEAPPRPREVKLDLPVNAYLPKSYIGRDDLRLEAYRRMAASESEDDVRDVAAEWVDRFGPLPPPVALLLDVALLRVACIKTEVREVAVVRRGGALQVRGDVVGAGGAWMARLSPVEIRASLRARLDRLYPGAIYKESEQQLVVPLAAGQESPRELARLVESMGGVPAGAAAPPRSQAPKVVSIQAT